MNINYPKVLIAVTAATLLAGASAHASEMDERIESSIQGSYVFRTYLKDDAIQTRSVDGFVVLKGTVAEEAHKALAQETVAGLPGVKSVQNQLEVTSARLAEGSDEWTSKQVQYSFLYNRYLTGRDIGVVVTDGVVTLNGNADNQAQKDLAGEYAKDIAGVKGVKNEMTVVKNEKKTEPAPGEKMDDASITAQVKLALLFRHSTGASKIGVETHNGVITLNGKANSGAGKDLATKVANDVRGVTQVINNMTVEDSLSKN